MKGPELIIAVLIWIPSVLITILFGFDNNPYLEHIHGSSTLQHYPIQTVSWIIVLMTIQIFTVLRVLNLRDSSPSWKRLLLTFLISLAFLSLGIRGSMHSHPAFGFYLVWLFLFATFIFSIFISKFTIDTFNKYFT